LIAIEANIESQEWRQQYCAVNNIPTEHPLASTTNDVECIFSVLRDTVGKDFTLKDALVGYVHACPSLCLFLGFIWLEKGNIQVFEED